MFLPSPLLFLTFVCGVAALILGYRKVGASLIAPAILRWIVFPAMAPLLGRFPWEILLLFAPLIIVFGGLKLLQSGVNAVYGPRAAGHVAGTYLVRAFDGLAAAAVWLVVAPFRLLAWLIASQRA